jgi:hypothetical protein
MAGGAEAPLWGRVFERPKNVVSRKIAGEMFVIPVAGKLADMEQMFALTAVAEFIWERLDGERSLGEIRDDLLARYAVDGQRVDGDVQEFVAELVGAGLLAEVTR